MRLRIARVLAAIVAGHATLGCGVDAGSASDSESSLSISPTTYTTHRGFAFTRVDDAQMGPAWRAPDGTVWSSCRGTFTNVGRPQTCDPFLGTVADSPATMACERIGGRLPLIEDYQRLMVLFQAGPHSVWLDPPEAEDYRALFPDCNASQRPGVYWTASGCSDSARVMRGFDPFGDVVPTENRFLVRCLANE